MRVKEPHSLVTQVLTKLMRKIKVELIVLMLEVMTKDFYTKRFSVNSSN